jgi:hypothetical protein
MRKVVITTAVAAALSAAPFGLAAVAAADPFDGSGADVVVKKLRDQGYNVQINTTSNQPLSQCTATGIHPSNLDDSAPLQDKQHTLVQVDVSCPSH